MRGIFDIDNPVMIWLIKIFDCICVSLLWLLFSLPVVTMGAASAALYATVYKYLRKGEGDLWRTFWGAFRENLRRSIIVWIVVLAVFAVLTADVLVFRTMAINGSPFGKIYWLILILCCVAVTWAAYLSAYAARFEGSAGEVLCYASLLMAWHPVRAVYVLLMILGGCAAVLAVPGVIGVVPAVVCWGSSVTLEKVFLLHMRPEDAEKMRDGGDEH